MNVYFKASGRKIKLPQASIENSHRISVQEPGTHWEFTPRCGGWVVAECFQEIEGVRTRLIRKKMMLAETPRSQGMLGGAHLSVHFGTSTWFGELVQEAVGGVSRGAASESDLVAQFPGKVRKIMAQENQVVKEGAVLVLIEAMKMEFAIRAPSAGKVLRMRVSEGEQVTPGTKFLDWEAL